MKNLNITAGSDYKVTNKLTKEVQVMNAQELATFVFKNDYNKYKIEDLNRKLVDRIPTWLVISALIVLTVASGLLHIQLNY